MIPLFDLVAEATLLSLPTVIYEGLDVTVGVIER